MKNSRCKVVVLISGNGSNLQAIIDGADKSCYTIAAVVSNKADAYGLIRAAKHNIPTLVLDHRNYASRNEFDMALIEMIDPLQPDLLVLAGFMRILSAEFVQHFAQRTINIHPSLLPKFPGINTHQRAIDEGEKEHGASVHFVTEELDGGPVIAQARIKVQLGETAEELKSRVATEEHRLYPFVVDLFASGRLVMSNHQAILDAQALPSSGLELPAQLDD